MRPRCRRALVQVVLALGVLAAPSVASAQPSSRVPTIGVLAPGFATQSLEAPARQAFERGLQEHGWIPGQTIRIEYRYAEARSDRLDGLAREILRLGVDVIVARSTGSIRAAARTTGTVPIVMSAAGIDPVDAGIVASLARPGGNVTGLTLLTQDLSVKQLEFLKEVVPRLSRVAVLGSTTAPLATKGRQGLEAAGRALGLQLHYTQVGEAGELETAFADMVRARAGGLVVLADPFILEPNNQQVVALAAKHRLPAVYWLDRYVHIGGLMSYGADLVEIHRRSAFYVDRLLRGAKAADLPIEEPTKFAMIVNLTTARALGLRFPPSIQARANEIIQ